MPQHQIRIRLLTTVASLIALVLTSGSAAIGAAEPPVAAVNAGGDDLVTTSGDLFAADTMSPSSAAYFSGGRPRSVPGAVTGTADPDLSSTTRAGARFEFAAGDVIPGSYEITFHFVEPEAAQPGDRVFDVTVEGVTVLDDFDIVAAAGGTLVAHATTVTADVTDGTLDVAFVRAAGRAVVAAVAVRQTGYTPGAVTVAPSALDFGSVVVGIVGEEGATVTNGGDSVVTLLSTQVAGTGFAVASPPFR